MDQITKVKKRLKQEQWKALIKECQSSKMTVSSWCKANGICEQTYYRNLKRIREQLCATLPISVMSSLPSTNAKIIVHLSNATIEICEGTCQQTIQAVLSALNSIC